MTRYALWQQLVGYPAQTDRLFPQEIWPMPGRLRGLTVTVGTGRVVNIDAGSAVVALGGGQGSALCVSDAVETATFAAAPGAGSSRIDLLIVQVHDQAIDAGGQNGFTFDIVQGAPTANPIPPAVPARAIVLASVTSVGGQANLAPANIAMNGPRATTADPPIYGIANISGNLVNGIANIALSLYQVVGVDLSGNTNLTVRTPGLYLVTTAITLNGNGNNPAGSYMQIQQRRNGAAISVGAHVILLNQNPFPSLDIAELSMCFAGDTLSVVTLGGGMTNTTAIGAGQFSVVRLADYGTT